MYVTQIISHIFWIGYMYVGILKFLHTFFAKIQMRLTTTTTNLLQVDVLQVDVYKAVTLTWIYLIARGGSRIFFRRGCTRLLLYFNTNKPHSFFFGGGIPVVLENRRSSQVGGGGVRTPCTLPLDPPLIAIANKHF